jgi:hypothetical protein
MGICSSKPAEASEPKYQGGYVGDKRHNRFAGDKYNQTASGRLRSPSGLHEVRLSGTSTAELSDAIMSIVLPLVRRVLCKQLFDQGLLIKSARPSLLCYRSVRTSPRTQQLPNSHGAHTRVQTRSRSPSSTPTTSPSTPSSASALTCV